MNVVEQSPNGSLKEINVSTLQRAWAFHSVVISCAVCFAC